MQDLLSNCKPCRQAEFTLRLRLMEHAVEHCAERDPAMTRIAILGATGYTALELIKILLHHP